MVNAKVMLAGRDYHNYIVLIFNKRDVHDRYWKDGFHTVEEAKEYAAEWDYTK